ncbi:MAG: 50S ribosomal protein L3 [Firmicutes bacterium]|jgi:large subunit ribosomal protein L3|nr:50S ribosomal protein L3 [Candidatus Fermentithermobacillaceae bacterium]HON87802.1 50S ribosomal protein L3 [Bacillota bacterium]HRC53979.1 50S ribosomal protein L3 [Bacillota bacterium]
MKAILGKKIGMTQVFDEEGKLIPVTVLEAGPCTVVDVKTEDRDGYDAVQIGFGFVSEKRLTKPQKGYFKSKGVTPTRYLREFRVAPGSSQKIGDQVKVDVFSSGEYVDVTGTSLGKGYAGGIKRWNFRRGPSSHGSKYHRGPGSLQARDAARVWKGRKMPGHKGSERVTVKNLKVVDVDPEKNLLLVYGGVPGSRGSLVMIREASR